MWVVALGYDDMSDMLTCPYLLEDVDHLSLIDTQLSMSFADLTREMCERLADKSKSHILATKCLDRLTITDKYRQYRLSDLARFSESEMVREAEILTENEERLWLCHGYRGLVINARHKAISYSAIDDEHKASIVWVDREYGAGDLSLLEELKKSDHLVAKLDHIIYDHESTISYMGDAREQKLSCESLVSIDEDQIVYRGLSGEILESVLMICIDLLREPKLPKVLECFLVSGE